jgi:hypothetical protein
LYSSWCLLTIFIYHAANRTAKLGALRWPTMCFKIWRTGGSGTLDNTNANCRYN